MLIDSGTRSVGLYSAITMLLLTVFAIDWLTPLRVAVWVFYMLPVALCMWVDRPNAPFITAGAASVLTLTAYILTNGHALTRPPLLQLTPLICAPLNFP